SKVRHFLWQNLRKLNLDLLCDPNSNGCRKKTDAKFRSADRGFVASVVSGGFGVDYDDGGVKDGNDYGMIVVYIETISTSVWGIFENFKNLDAKSDEWEDLVTGTSVFFIIVEIVT
ncbi:hypothetical protein Tco_1196644, partial [Tanacetum coccineum]